MHNWKICYLITKYKFIWVWSWNFLEATDEKSFRLFCYLFILYRIILCQYFWSLSTNVNNINLDYNPSNLYFKNRINVMETYVKLFVLLYWNYIISSASIFKEISGGIWDYWWETKLIIRLYYFTHIHFLIFTCLSVD